MNFFSIIAYDLIVEIEKYSQILEFIKNNLNVGLSLDSSLKTKRGLQHFISHKFSDKEMQKIYEIILSYAVSAEKLCPSSGVSFLKKIVNKDTNGNLTQVFNSKIKLINFIENKNYKKLITEILLFLIESSDSNTKISFKKSSSSTTYVEISRGFTFEAKKILKEDKLSFKNVYVACIDGYIENISELHHFLEEISSIRIPCFLFVRGMSDDVIHTIKVNNDRKTFFVFPYVIPFDLENANTIVDIAIVSGTDVLSNLKGQLISSINIGMIGKVDSITVSNEMINIQNVATIKSVQNHLNNLINSLEEKNEIVAPILQKRINALSSNKIEICIPDDINFFSTSQQLDEGIRIISAMLNKKFDPDFTALKYLNLYELSLKDTFKVFTSN